MCLEYIKKYECDHIQEVYHSLECQCDTFCRAHVLKMNDICAECHAAALALNEEKIVRACGGSFDIVRDKLESLSKQAQKHQEKCTFM